MAFLSKREKRHSQRPTGRAIRVLRDICFFHNDTQKNTGRNQKRAHRVANISETTLRWYST